MNTFRLSPFQATNDDAAGDGVTSGAEAVTDGQRRGRELSKSATLKSHASACNARGVSMTIHDIQRLVAYSVWGIVTVLGLTSARMAQAVAGCQVAIRLLNRPRPPVVPGYRPGIWQTAIIRR